MLRGLSPADYVRWQWQRVQTQFRYGWQRLLYRMDRRRGLPVAHFIHVGKTGGSAMRAVLSDYARKGTYRVIAQSHSWTMRNVPAGEKFFFVLRHPVDRFVSAFYGRQRQDRPRIISPWRAEEAIAFAEFESAEDLALSLSSDDPGRKARAEEAMRGIQHVRDSYSRWFVGEETLASRKADILFIGFQEQLEEDFPILRDLLGMPSSASLPSDGVRAHRNPPKKKALSAQARSNLERWYAKDIQFYETCKALRRNLDAERAASMKPQSLRAGDV